MPIHESVYRQIKRFSAQQSSTPFGTLLAGFYILLNYLSRQADLVIGSHVADQPLVGGHDLVGFCVNMIALRSKIDEASKIEDYLSSVMKLVLEAHQHRSYPFARLVKRLRLQRDSSRAPLVTAIFNMDPPAIEPQFSELKVKAGPSPPISARFQLLWNVVENGGGLLIKGEYNTDLFDGHTIQSWLQTYNSILEFMVSRPAATVGELTRSLAGEVRMQRASMKGGLATGNAPRLDRIRRRAIDYPD